MAEVRWYIGVVADIADPDKRRRLRVRGPNETEEVVETEKLPWINAFVTSANDFQLPEEASNVLILDFGQLKLWTELPEYGDWQNFSDDDYATAYQHKHKDKKNEVFEESKGWTVLYKGDLLLTRTDADDAETIKTTITGTDKIEVTDSTKELKYTKDKVSLETDGSTLKLTVNKAVIETDGSKISLKNGSKNLFDILDKLVDEIIKTKHMTSQGPSGPPMPDHLAKYDTIKSDIGALLY